VEFLQGALTTRRGAELGDWIADMAGVLGAALVHRIVRGLSTDSLAPGEDAEV
jgi:hypothetical protein